MISDFELDALVQHIATLESLIAAGSIDTRTVQCPNGELIEFDASQSNGSPLEYLRACSRHLWSQLLVNSVSYG